MSNQKGFSLVSFLLYLMLFSLIMLFSCHVVTSLIIPSLASLRKCQSLISVHTATDLFVRDIRHMANGDHQWKVMGNRELIWNQNGNDIGWSFSDNRMERREGSYDREWKNSTMSTIVRSIALATFIPDKKGDHIIGIELVLVPEKQKEKPIICYVALQKGKKT